MHQVFIHADPAAEAECDKQNAVLSALVGAAISVGVMLAIAVVPLSFGALFPAEKAGAEAMMDVAGAAVVPVGTGGAAAVAFVGRMLPAMAQTNVPLRTIPQ